MDKKIYCLGIDTSNYTTSAALVDTEFNIVSDSRAVLKVKQGERGLRQSQALFEHIGNLPGIIEALGYDEKEARIAVVSVSDKPRQVEGSYMPVFKAGETVGKSIASMTGAEYFSFSHQEGHIEAAGKFTDVFEKKEFLSLHLSGGTTEVLKCSKNEETGGYVAEIVGGTKDISLGQLIDRIGVSLGLSFPSGKIMDEAACRDIYSKAGLKDFCRIKVDDCMMNISGIETQIQRYIKEKTAEGNISDAMLESISRAVLFRASQAIEDVINQARARTGIEDVLVAGGVASSRYVRNYLSKDSSIRFGKPELSSDNAVGTALLGMKKYLKAKENSVCR